MDEQPLTRLVEVTLRGLVRERLPGWLLRRIPGIGPAKSAELITAHDSVLGVFRAAQDGEINGTLGGKITAAWEE